jgi:hypothetical protein
MKQRSLLCKIGIQTSPSPRVGSAIQELDVDAQMVTPNRSTYTNEVTMDTDEAITVLKMLKIRKIRPSKDNFIHTQCFFAPYADEHGDHYDGNPSMWISVNNGVSYCECWTCGTNMKAGFKQRFVDAVEAVNRLSDGLHAEAVKKARESDKSSGQRFHRAAYLPSDYTEDYEEFIRTDELPTEWLRAKGIERHETLRDFRIGVANEIVLFPIINRINVVVGAQARSTKQKEQAGKYFSVYEDTQKSHHLFGEHLLDLEYIDNRWAFKGKAIVVFEGPLDVMHAYDVGVRNVVGIMGAKISPVQAKLLAKLARQKMIALVLDPDKAGRQGAYHSLNRVFLEHAPGALVQVYAPKIDPKEMTREDFFNLLNGDPAWQKRPIERMLQDLERAGKRRS